MTTRPNDRTFGTQRWDGGVDRRFRGNRRMATSAHHAACDAWPEHRVLDGIRLHLKAELESVDPDGRKTTFKSTP